jgi:hypothetical protein
MTTKYKHPVDGKTYLLVQNNHPDTHHDCELCVFNHDEMIESPERDKLARLCQPTPCGHRQFVIEDTEEGRARYAAYRMGALPPSTR